MEIRVYPDIVEREIKNINESIKDYDIGIQNIRNTINEMSQIWKDNNYQYFNDKTNNFLMDLAQIGDILQNYHDFLDGYMNAGEKVDSFYQNKNINIK